MNNILKLTLDLLPYKQPGLPHVRRHHRRRPLASPQALPNHRDPHRSNHL